MTGPNSARSPGSEGKETMTQKVARRSALATLGTVTRPPPRRGMVVAAATLGFGVIQLDVSVVNVAVKPIGATLGGGVSSVQWVVDAYTLVFAALILSAGALGDRSGHKRLLMAGFAVFTLASLACGLVPAIGELIAARAVQGAAAAALGASSLSLINHTYPDAAGRARAVSVWTAGGAATLAAGPLIGGLLIATVGWRSIFFINLPLGALGWWLTRRYATTTPAAPARPAVTRAVDARGRCAPPPPPPCSASTPRFLPPINPRRLPTSPLMGARLPGHARPASRPCRPAGPGADRGPVTDRLRHRPGRHRHHLRLLGSVAPAQSGIASGTFTAFRQTGSVLGVALFGTLLASLRPSTGLEVTFAIGAGLVAVVAALAHAAR